MAGVGGSKSLSVESSGLHSADVVGHFVGGASLAGGADYITDERSVGVTGSDAENEHGPDFPRVA